MILRKFSNCSWQRRQHRGPQSFEMPGFASWQAGMLSRSFSLMNRESMHALVIEHMDGRRRDRLFSRKLHLNGMGTSVYCQRCLSMDILHAVYTRERSMQIYIQPLLKKNFYRIAMLFLVQGR